MDIAQFEVVLNNLMSPDNAVRTNAEQIFNEAKKNPDFIVGSLVQCIRASQQEEVRKFATILLRRILTKGNDSMWPHVTPQVQEAVKTQLLQAVQAESANQVRKALSDTVAHIGALILEKGGQWNELLPFLFQCVKSETDLHREAALNIFSDLATHIGDKLRPFFAVLKDVLSAGLSDKSSKVRISALDATANFLHELTEPHERQVFQQLIPMMLNCIGTALNEKNEEDAVSGIEIFVELAEIDPTFIRPHLAMVINAMVQITQQPTFEDDTRNLALEFIITLAENKASMARKFPKFVDTVLPIILNLMVQLDDDLAEWNSKKDEEDDEIDITNSDVGEEALDRLSLALGGKTVVPVLFAMLPGMLGNSDWRYRHAGLLAISIVGEGSQKFILANLNDIVKNIVPFFADQHPRVRWAACNTVGQMSTDFGPELQNKHHASLLPALIAVMDDKQNPRVQSHAASAVINFCEHCKPATLATYLDPLLAKLYTLLQSGSIVVQEQTITAIAAIADCAEEYFHKYYDTFTPILKSILANANGKEHRLLRGKAIECVSLIGVAVGKEKFAKDAKEIMELMLKTQSSKMDPDDPQVSFLLQSWARICKCLGMDFVPYLPHVMPPLLASSKIAPDVKVSELDDTQEDEGWDYIPVGDKRIGIHTSGLEEKATACNMLYCYAAELKEGFFPYVEEVTKILVPLVKFYYHDGVRSAAFTTMPLLLLSASEYLKKQGAKGSEQMYIRNLLNFMLTPMLESLREEIDMELLSIHIQSFSECIVIAGEGILTAEQVQAAVKLCVDLMEDIKERRQERLDKKKEEDHDEEEEERIEDEAERDDEILSSVTEFLGQLGKFHKAHFLGPWAAECLAFYLEFLKPTSKASDRQTALCMFDDLAEYCGSDAFQFYNMFLPSVVNYIVDQDASVRQAAVYGIGCVAVAGGDQIAPFIPEMLNRLIQVISHPESRGTDYVMATENAIASVGKILMHQSKAVDVAAITPLWLSWLPVKEDAIESKVTYRILLSFLESNNPHLIGANYANIPAIVNIFGEILETDLVDADITVRIKNYLHSLPQELVGKFWSTINPVYQAKLLKLNQ